MPNILYSSEIQITMTSSSYKFQQDLLSELAVSFSYTCIVAPSHHTPSSSSSAVVCCYCCSLLMKQTSSLLFHLDFCTLSSRQHSRAPSGLTMTHLQEKQEKQEMEYPFSHPELHLLPFSNLKAVSVSSLSFCKSQCGARHAGWLKNHAYCSRPTIKNL